MHIININQTIINYISCIYNKNTPIQIMMMLYTLSAYDMILCEYSSYRVEKCRAF